MFCPLCIGEPWLASGSDTSPACSAAAADWSPPADRLETHTNPSTRAACSSASASSAAAGRGSVSKRSCFNS